MEIEDVRRCAQRVVSARGRVFGLSAEDREDLLQEVLIKYVRAWPASAEPDNVEAWLETAIGRLITDRWRAGQRRPPQAQGDGESDAYDLVAHLVERSRSRQASRPVLGDAVIDQVFRLVSDEDADLLKQRFVDDVNAGELAADLGITRAAVDQRVKRAKGRLLAALDERPDLVRELREGHPHVYPLGQR